MQTHLKRLIIFVSLMLLSRLSFSQEKSEDKELTKKLEHRLDDFKGKAGIYTFNLKTQKEAAINADTIFPTASIVKVPILVGVFKKITEDGLNYHDSVMYRDSMASGGSGVMQYFKDSTEIDVSIPINLMMAYSDNTAAIWCEKMAGGENALNTMLNELGYKHTRVNSELDDRADAYKKYGWGQTTPREMSRLLVAIRNRDILTPAASERMYRIMTDTYWDEYALAEIPPYVQAASKQGMVNGSRSELVMVNAPHGDYVFYIATKNNTDESWKIDNEAWQLARDVSQLLWNYYEPDNKWNPAKGSSKFWDWQGVSD